MSNIPSDRLIDTSSIELYCHGVARIDALGPNRRLVFTVPSVDEPGYQHVVVKLILPAELMTTLAYMAAGADPQSISRALVAAETRTAN